ncbi:MAG: 2-oxo acid dehydrogenase subunit E2 [Deltaproteobacteria bacterium]|nr:2-oxo acid dehydrogenase subunit E2 [Deltaproteobacteria bacterium]
MPKEFRLPDLGEGIHEGEIVEILVSVGDRVIDGQPVMLVETDKATTEVPAPVTGIVQEIRVKPGDVVKVGDVLMVFLAEGEEGKRPAKFPEVAPPELSTIPEKPAHVQESVGRRVEVRSEVRVQAAKSAVEKEGPVPAAPSTRRLARELGVDLRSVQPSGPGGRVTSEDVLRFSAQAKREPEPARTPAPQEAERPVSGAPLRVDPLPDFDQWGEVERVPLRSVRRATARHMAVAWSQVPHVTHQDVADVTELEALRRRHKASIAERGGVLSLTVFALKAAVTALKEYPRFNSSLDMEAEEIVLKRYYHIGVAVDTDRGLIVPVIRDVDRKSMTELAVELKSLAERTRGGRVEREDMAGGTFTITNIGILGGTAFTPIVNFPETAILGLGQARWQAVVKLGEDGEQMVPRLMLPVILGFDHRVLDGADAARFVNRIVGLLGEPERLLLH